MPYLDNEDKYCGAGQARDDNIIMRMCFACWVTKATSTTNPECIILMLFHDNNVSTSVLSYTYIACFVVICLATCCYNVDLDEQTWMWSINRITVDRGYLKYSERENSLKTTLSAAYPTWITLGSNFGLSRRKATKWHWDRIVFRVFRFTPANRHSTSALFPLICHPAPVQ